MAEVTQDLPRVAEERLDAAELDLWLKGARKPFVLRGLAKDWPLVRAGLESAQAARDYLAGKARDRAFPIHIGTPGGGDRLFYNAAMGMNFQTAQGPLPAILEGIAANEDKPAAPTIYLSSIDMDAYFEGLADENTLPLGSRKPLESIWIGSRTRIAAHNDVPDNVAVCAVGRRRFTLFPRQFTNLYRPLENTPAGRPEHGDAAAHVFAPLRLPEALGHASVAEPSQVTHSSSFAMVHQSRGSAFNVL